MYHEILVPLDGTKLSENILTHVVNLTKLAPAKVHVVHVVGNSNEDLIAGQAYVKSVMAAWSEKFVDIDGTVLIGKPEKEILTFAVMHRCDLIALITHARTGLKRLVYGSVAEEMLHNSVLPLYLARPHVASKPIKRIVVALDGSPRAKKVLALATDLAKAGGAKLTLLQVVEAETAKERAATGMTAAAGAATKSGVESVGVVRVGQPAKQILDAARDGSDLIALTTHGRTGLDKVRFGSVAEDVIHGSETPVLVLRTGFMSRLGKTRQGPRTGKRRRSSASVSGMLGIMEKAHKSSGLGH